MIRVKSLVWDNWNREHIKKHKVSVMEVEGLCRGTFKQQPSYGQKVMIFGITKTGRRLTIVLSRKRPGVYYPVTARDTSKKERRMFLK
ncbi:MAG: hypothetical protein AAB656_02375 [Patescibacteria group bacterium]